jgi:hypothetical protein
VRIAVLKRIHGRLDEQMGFHGKSHYGYKLSVCVDRKHKLIRRLKTDTARTPSHARTGFALTLMAACYNIRRTVWLVKSNAIPW